MAEAEISKSESREHREKQVHEMNCLRDLTWLPVSAFWIVGIYTGAVVYLTSVVHSYHWETYYMLFWLVFAAAVTLLPIFILRLVALRQETSYPVISRVRILTDFYKLSDWVYLLLVATLGWWIVVSWVVLTYRNTGLMAAQLVACGLLCALSPWGVRFCIHVLGRRS